MLEYQLLRHCMVPERYQAWREDVDPSSFSPPAREVWGVLKHWYGQRDDVPTAGSLVPYRLVAMPAWDDDRAELLETGVAQLDAIKIDVPADTVIRLWLEREVAAAVAEEADKFIEKPEAYSGGLLTILDKEVERLRKYQSFSSDAGAIESDMEADLVSVVAQLSTDGSVNWRLKCLQVAVGPLYLGQLIVIGGRMESGKTTLLASEVAHMIQQLPEDGIVAFFNNESANPAVKFRLYQAVLGAPRDKIIQHIDRANAKVKQLLGGRQVMVMDVHNKGIGDVERRLAALGDRVGLVVFDQASKLAGLEKSSSNEAERLQKLTARLKGLASTVAPVMTTVWADASAEGEMWVGKDQLYGSKTGIPGEAETIITVGHTGRPEDEGVRFLNIPKNKSLTCQDERQRHSQHTVAMRPEIARVDDAK